MTISRSKYAQLNLASWSKIDEEIGEGEVDNVVITFARSYFYDASHIEATLDWNSPNPPILRTIVSLNVTNVPETTAKFMDAT